MMKGAKSVGSYLEELGRNKEGRDEQVKQGLEIYIDLWKKAIEKGVVASTDDVETALEKLDQKGGLYKAAED
jgi:hypothetical protein